MITKQPSVPPASKANKAIDLKDDHIDKVIPEEELEYDIVVHMPPKKRYSIELEVNSIKRAKPRVVEPELI